MMRGIVPALVLCLSLVVAGCAPLVATGVDEPRHATCNHYATQADAQRAAAATDRDGDGVYCETLPCPCAGGPPSSIPSPTAAAPRATTPRTCRRPSGVQHIAMSRTRYPNIYAHAEAAIAAGWPRVLVINRAGATARRARLLARMPTRDGMDRDEYPPAVGRGLGPTLEQGSNPRGWMADVQYVPAAENRGHGQLLGVRLRHLCDGVRFVYAWY